MAQAALGLRVHSGWATMCGIAGPATRPTVLLRRRVELAGDGPRQPYHAAEGKPLAEATVIVARATDTAHDLGRRALADALAELCRAGHEVADCALLLASGTRARPELPRILASHALIHAAEGELFRDAIRSAAARLGVRSVEVREKELFDRGVAALGKAEPELRRRLDELGRPLGPPWRQDEKRATLVAWLALGG